MKTTEKHLNWDFSTLVDWFVDKKLNVHFGEDKTKSILFSPKHRSKSIGQIDISYKDVKIKQYSKMTYLGCVLGERLTKESMTIQVCTKVASKLKLLYGKNRFISKELRRLLCNALIQSHFDYACVAWYPNLNKNIKKNCRFYKSSVYVPAYSWTTEKTSELNVLTRLTGFQ